MLNIPFGRVRFCDGISRRNFLKVGAFSFGAVNLTLADILRAEAAAAQDDLPRTGHKALINIFLGGGPPHQDMWEIKTEVRLYPLGDWRTRRPRCLPVHDRVAAAVAGHDGRTAEHRQRRDEAAGEC
jgi:hypothetical protein